MIRQLLILAAVVAVASANLDWKEVQKILKECAEELGYKPSFPKPDDKEGQKKYNCFLRCRDLKMGIIDEKGELVLEKIIEKMSFPKDRTEKAVETCNQVTADDECETAAKRVNCLSMEADPTVKIYKECRAELGLKDGEGNGGKQNCVTKCTAQKKGTIDENGALNSKMVGEIFPAEQDKIDEAVRACDKRTVEDECDQVAEKMKCLLTKLSENKKT